MHNEVLVWEQLYATHMTDDIMILTHFTHSFTAERVLVSFLSPKYTTLWSQIQRKHYVSEEHFDLLSETRKHNKATFHKLCRQNKSDISSRKGRKANSTVKNPGKYTINISASSTFCTFYHHFLDNSATSKTHLQKYCQVLNRTESVTPTVLLLWLWSSSCDIFHYFAGYSAILCPCVPTSYRP